MPTPTLFLKLVIKGKMVPGSSDVEGFKGLIALESMNWGMTAVHKQVTASEKRTEHKPKELRLSKVFDKSSTAIYANMKTREKFDSATITMVDAMLTDGRPKVMMTMDVQSGYIESVDARAADAGNSMRLSETIVLSFKNGKVSYSPFNSKTNTRASPMTYTLPLDVGGKDDDD